MITLTNMVLSCDRCANSHGMEEADFFFFDKIHKQKQMFMRISFSMLAGCNLQHGKNRGSIKWCEFDKKKKKRPRKRSNHETRIPQFHLSRTHLTKHGFIGEKTKSVTQKGSTNKSRKKKTQSRWKIRPAWSTSLIESHFLNCRLLLQSVTVT